MYVKVEWVGQKGREEGGCCKECVKREKSACCISSEEPTSFHFFEREKFLFGEKVRWTSLKKGHSSQSSPG